MAYREAEPRLRTTYASTVRVRVLGDVDTRTGLQLEFPSAPRRRLARHQQAHHQHQRPRDPSPPPRPAAPTSDKAEAAAPPPHGPGSTRTTESRSRVVASKVVHVPATPGPSG
jgi:hypothetical protein